MGQGGSGLDLEIMEGNGWVPALSFVGADEFAKLDSCRTLL